MRLGRFSHRRPMLRPAGLGLLSAAQLRAITAAFTAARSAAAFADAFSAAASIAAASVAAAIAASIAAGTNTLSWEPR